MSSGIISSFRKRAFRITRRFRGRAPAVPYQRILLERDRQRILLATCSTIVSVTDIEQIVSECLRGLPRIVDCEGACLILLATDSEQIVRVAAAGDFPEPPKPALEASLRDGLLKQAKQDEYSYGGPRRQPWMAPAPLMDPLLEGRTSGLMVAVARAKNTVGFLIIAEPAGGSGFTRENIELVVTMGRAIAVAVDNARLIQQTRDNEQRLRELLWRLVDTAESERRRVAGEIHDWMGQRFFDFYYALRRCQELCAGYDPAVTGQLARVTESARQCSDDIRDFMNRLHPSIIDDFGFVTVLRDYVTSLQQQGEFTVHLSAPEEDAPRLPKEVNMSLLRILEEAIVNARKHSSARHLTIEFSQNYEEACLSMRDDGCGFDTGRVVAGHFGVFYMHERAKACGGQLTLVSSPGQGTEIRVRVPTR
jgi:signal transduction histidine kinase